MAWFSIPLRILQMYLAMLPRLRAEESIRAVTEAQVATGKGDEVQEIWDAWREAAFPDSGEVEASAFYL